MEFVPVIAGPTASGKSALALRLAERLGGEIINADAMQVYADLRVLTARPSASEEAMVPHHLYGVSPGNDPWSAGRFASAAARAIADVTGRGKVPIVVGGTGLWLKALTVGLSPVPEVAACDVAAAEADWVAMGSDAFRQRLILVDPAMANLKPLDRQRHVRAWSVYAATGRALTSWQAEPPTPPSTAYFCPLVLLPDRRTNYDYANARFMMMVDEGVREVASLVARDWPQHLPVMKAVGVPELSAFIDGRSSRQAAIEAAQQSTRRLIKRQSTWFNGQFADWAHVQDAEAALAFFAENLPPDAA